MRLVFIQRWSGIVNHISDEHPCEDLNYLRKVLSALTSSMVWQSYVVPIKPNVLKMEGKSIETIIQVSSILFVRQIWHPGRALHINSWREVVLWRYSHITKLSQRNNKNLSEQRNDVTKKLRQYLTLTCKTRIPKLLFLIKSSKNVIFDVSRLTCKRHIPIFRYFIYRLLVGGLSRDIDLKLM